MADMSSVAGLVPARPSHYLLGIGYQSLIDARQSGGGYELMLFVVPAGVGPPPHRHSREDECFYVIEGRFEMTVGDRVSTAEAGAFVHLPRIVFHTFRNVGGGEGRFLCWAVPGGLGAFFEALGHPLGEGAIPPPAEADIAKLMEIAPRYGMEVLG